MSSAKPMKGYELDAHVGVANYGELEHVHNNRYFIDKTKLFIEQIQTSRANLIFFLYFCMFVTNCLMMCII